MAAGTIKKITMQDYILSGIPPNRYNYDLKSILHLESYLNSLALKNQKVSSKDLKIRKIRILNNLLLFETT